MIFIISIKDDLNGQCTGRHIYDIYIYIYIYIYSLGYLQ